MRVSANGQSWVHRLMFIGRYLTVRYSPLPVCTVQLSVVAAHKQAGVRVSCS